MKRFEDQNEAIEAMMEKLEELPDEKLAFFFINLFGSEGLLEMARDFIEAGEYDFKTEKDVDGFIAQMLS